jgi:hypothetical protein
VARDLNCREDTLRDSFHWPGQGRTRGGSVRIVRRLPSLTFVDDRSVRRLTKSAEELPLHCPVVGSSARALLGG